MDVRPLLPLLLLLPQGDEKGFVPVFNGKDLAGLKFQFEAKDVDVVSAQATAFVVGLMKADKGKGARKLGALLRDLLKRDSLPDLDKTLGWKKDRWQAESDKAIEAATGR